MNQNQKLESFESKARLSKLGITLNLGMATLLPSNQPVAAVMVFLEHGGASNRELTALCQHLCAFTEKRLSQFESVEQPRQWRVGFFVAGQQHGVVYILVKHASMELDDAMRILHGGASNFIHVLEYL